MKTSDWFTSWFDTKYYHILYKNRNNNEAKFFINNIINFLNLPFSSHIADIPCGRGRHSIYLNNIGYKVTGCDLSRHSIDFAKKFENKNLNFKVCDMREPYREKYDAFFNLFTSFGYFKNDKDDILVLKNIKKSLNDNGVFVLDFLNIEKVKNNLISQETKIVDNIKFNIKREIKNNFILKRISFFSEGNNYSFIEKVKLLDYKKLNFYFKKSNFKINHTFGDYSLNSFNKNLSDRLIIVAK